MKMYKIINNEGNAMLGFNTMVEAKQALKEMRQDKKWTIIRYIAENYEKNYN